MWESAIDEFKNFLRIEKSLSAKTIEAYLTDVKKLIAFLNLNEPLLEPTQVKEADLWRFIQWIAEQKVANSSQSRIISGVRAFFRFLLHNEKITIDPTELLETPRINRKFPQVLSILEIDAMIAAIDLSQPEGHRNKAIIETLYSCGLRVSELVDLKITGLHFDEGYISVFGKGNKQRLVPISDKAICEINLYLDNYRKHLKINKSFVNHVFLNHRGQKLSRVMIFNIIKQLAAKAGIDKNISPHTFRHSFASHLVDGGADLRAVQDMLGHESITTTEIYTHLNFDYLRSAVTDFHPRGRMKYLKNEPTNMNLI